MRCFLISLAIAIAPGLAPANTSALWPRSGDTAPSATRLPDFSRAGYHDGDERIPSVPVANSVKSFGAVGDGVADDTKAIQAAIDATSRGAVLIPEGRYKITDYLRIAKPGVVLRGAGADRTTLWFPRGLDEIHPREMHDSRGLPTSGYSFDGAFVSIEGDYRARPLARIVATARRGDREIAVDSSAGLVVGAQVLIVVHEDAAQSLKQSLYGGDAGDISHGKPLDSKMVARITAIDGDRLRLDRPLRFETRAEWTPRVQSFEPTVTESGIESLGFAFPATKYRGHFKENGANAVELRNVFNCWVRDVRVHNADMGFTIVACHNTVDGVVITADRARETREGAVDDCTGHHAFQCKAAEDNLVTHFDIQTCYVHDLSVEHASGNVYAQGCGRDLCFDHHKDTPYENLYTAIDCGRATRVWHSGGGAGLGRECASFGTFWGIRGARSISPPPRSWGPDSLTFVGILSEVKQDTAAPRRWWEPVTDIEPTDLHAAQLDRRRKL